MIACIWSCRCVRACRACWRIDWLEAFWRLSASARVVALLIVATSARIDCRDSSSLVLRSSSSNLDSMLLCAMLVAISCAIICWRCSGLGRLGCGSGVSRPLVLRVDSPDDLSAELFELP